MLGDYFYHQIFRKSIIAFGTVFNNIVVKRKQPGVKVPTGKNAIESYKVPIQYGPYQKYLAMIAAEPNPERQAVQISLPRMSFEIKALNYDGARKMTPTTFARTVPRKPDPESGKPVQYSQFLPSFQPALNVSIEIIDVTHEERDIAIVLNGIGYTDDYEGDYSQRRTLIWTLNFTVKTYLFGPVDISKDIRKVTLDYRSDVVQRPSEVRYSAEVESTLDPPLPRDEIDPLKPETYKVVETYQDIFGEDNDYFGV